MRGFDILRQRLHNQHIARQTYDEPGDIVRHLGAMQAQDYPGAKWAVGMRLLDSTDLDIEKAFSDGAILRTHVMRPTWHFVAPDDIRWLLTLTAPRVNAANAHYYRRLELDEAIFSLGNTAIRNALEGGKQLTRAELVVVLERSGIAGDNLRLGYIMMRAELDAVMCSGPRHGNQFTYALLDERAPNAPNLEHDEALSELTRRYFTSHGPATIQDFAWWSGLTVAEVKTGLQMCGPHLTHETVEGLTYWYSQQPTTASPIRDISKRAYLLSSYDEYGIAYKERKGLIDPTYAELAILGRLPVVPFLPQIAVGGKILGSWKRTLTKTEVILEAYLFRTLAQAEMQALADEVGRYGRFMGLPATLQSRVL